MKKLSLLRKWTNVLFVLCMLLIIFTPGFTILYVIKPELVPAEVKIDGFETLTISKGVILLLIFVGYCMFVYCLYLFIKVLELFSKRKIFDAVVIINFRKIGRFVWYGLLLVIVPLPLYRLFTQNPINFSFDTDEFTFVLFTGSLALFFTVLSEVFQMAKNIKEENELTV